MIIIEPEHRLTITFTNTTDTEDITTFISILKKCNKEARKSGFKSMFSSDEKEFIKQLSETLNTKE